MTIAIDVSPLKSGRFLKHRVRGTGFYIENLKTALLQYFPNNKYTFFVRGEKIPKDVDLVHYPYFEPFFLTLPLFSPYKTVVTVHDLTPFVFPKEFPPGIKGNLKWQIQKRVLKSADAIITDSICSKNDIIKYTGISSSKIHVVYLAASSGFKKLDNSSILGSIRQKYNLPEKFVLYVGDATWNKNLPRFMEALEKANLPFVMVGKVLVERDFDRENPWNKDLVKIHKLAQRNKNIIRLGFVPKEDLVLLYNMATVFTMPSLYEGFGLPVLEALRCGCPVVTTKRGSLPEIGGDAVVYVDPLDVDQMTQTLKLVFENSKLRQSLSEKGLKQAKKFDWKKTAAETIKVYQKA